MNVCVLYDSVLNKRKEKWDTDAGFTANVSAHAAVPSNTHWFPPFVMYLFCLAH